MFRIADITDLKGVRKEERLNQIKTKYSEYGQLSELRCGVPFFFMYNDDSNMMLLSSKVTGFDYVTQDNLYIITTMNSIYYIEELTE